MPAWEPGEEVRLHAHLDSTCVRLTDMAVSKVVESIPSSGLQHALELKMESTGLELSVHSMGRHQVFHERGTHRFLAKHEKITHHTCPQVYELVHVHIFICMHTHTHTRAHINPHTCMYICTHTHTHKMLQ